MASIYAQHSHMMLFVAWTSMQAPCCNHAGKAPNGGTTLYICMALNIEHWMQADMALHAGMTTDR